MGHLLLGGHVLNVAARDRRIAAVLSLTPDTVVSSPAAERAARKATAPTELRHYPVDHFDVYADPWLSTLLKDQVEFVSRWVTPSGAAATATSREVVTSVAT